MTVTWTPEGAIDAVRRGAVRGVTMAVNEVRNEILRLIQQTPKSGREYRRRGVVHRASAPGEAPASDQGTLVREITVRVAETTDLVTGSVNSGAAHGSPLEFGTQTMEPRPYMRVGLANKRSEIEALVGREIAAEIAVTFGERS